MVWFFSCGLLKQLYFTNPECLRVHLWGKDQLSQLLYSIAVGVIKTTTVETTNEYFSKNGYGEHFPEYSELTRTFVLLSNI